MVIAGMGGETIRDILRAAPWAADGHHTLPLQPMTKVELRGAGCGKMDTAHRGASGAGQGETVCDPVRHRWPSGEASDAGSGTAASAWSTTLCMACIWSSSCGGFICGWTACTGAETRASRSRWRLWRIFWKKRRRRGSVVTVNDVTQMMSPVGSSGAGHGLG